MSKRILVVEDQPDNRQIIRDMLAPTDYEITEAKNGEEALTAIAKQRPDLILMDIQLPIMDGYAATRKLSFSAILCAGTAVRENNRYHWHGECRARRWAPIFRPTVTTRLLCVAI
jgi:CheY-like chemotaxis protein